MKSKIIICSFVAFIILSLCSIMAITDRKSIIEPKTTYVSGLIAFKTKDDLIIDSDIIIKGQVKEILPSKWSNPNYEKGMEVRNIIQTDVITSVNEIFKGNPYNTKEITVRIDKGKIGDNVFVSEGYPDFTVGEEVILFLSKDDSDLAKPEENYYVLTGMLQGKFALSNSGSSDGIYKNDKDLIHLNQFKDEVKAVIENEKANPSHMMTSEEVRNQNKKVLGE